MALCYISNNVDWRKIRIPRAYQYAVFIVFSAALYIALLPRFDIGFYNDDAAYVLAAKSLLTGHYRNLSQPLQPSTSFPFPGLPFFLLPFLKWVDPQWARLEWVSICITLGSVMLTWYLLRQWFSSALSFCTLILIAFNPTTAHLSGILMAEPYFLFLTLAVFLSLQKVVTGNSRLHGWLLGLLIGWASLTRPEGIILLPSVLLALAYAGRWESFCKTFALALALYLTVIFRNDVLDHAFSAEYTGDLTNCAHYWSQHYGSFLPQAGHIFEQFLLQNILAWPLRSVFQSWTLRIVAPGAGIVLMAAGLFRCSKEQGFNKELTLGAASFCYFYFLVHTLWLNFDVRYLMPLVPFALIFMVAGWLQLFKDTYWRRITGRTVFALLLVLYGFQNGFAVYESLFKPVTRNLAPLNTFAWVKQHTERAAVLLSPLAPGLYLYTNRPAISLLVTQDEEDLRHQLLANHVQYVLDRWTDTPFVSLDQRVRGLDINHQWKRIRRYMNLYPSEFKLVYEDSHEMTRIYAIALSPAFVQSYDQYLKALDDLRLHKVESGLARLRSSLQLYPRLAVAWNAYAVTLMGRTGGRAGIAESALQRAIAIRPLYPMAYLNLARLYKKTDRMVLSRQALQRGIDASRALDELEPYVLILRTAQKQAEIDAQEILDDMADIPGDSQSNEPLDLSLSRADLN